MFAPTRILHFEALVFVYGLAAIIAFKVLTGQINLDGLIRRKDRSGQTSPERVQLLLATLAAGARYLTQVAQAPNGIMPDIDNSWLYLMGGSSGIYVLHKAWSTFKAARQPGGKS